MEYLTPINNIINTPKVTGTPDDVSEVIIDSNIDTTIIINNGPTISKISFGGFAYEYSLYDKKFNIKAIHILSKRTWSNELYSLAWKPGVNLSALQVNFVFRNELVILPDTLPPTKSNLVLQLKFVFLDETYNVNLCLKEEDITDIQRLEMIIVDLRDNISILEEKSQNMTPILPKNIQNSIVDLEMNFGCLKEKFKNLTFNCNTEINKLRDRLDNTVSLYEFTNFVKMVNDLK